MTLNKVNEDKSSKKKEWKFFIYDYINNIIINLVNREQSLKNLKSTSVNISSRQEIFSLDKNEKICNGFSDAVSEKSILRLRVFKETTRQRGSLYFI